VIDSSFCTMYTGPSKPPTGEDLAVRGIERNFRRDQRKPASPTAVP
jgi:hypothetical protein